MPAGRANGTLIVVGAVNVDLVVVAERLPAAGETVVGSSLERHGGGKGANAAVAAARSGAAVRLIGAVGRDAMAQEALSDLREAGVGLDGIAELEDEPTGAALIVVDACGENQIAVGGGANSALGAEWVGHHLAEALPEAGCVLVSTEIPGPAVAAAVQAAGAAGVICVLNCAPPIPTVLELLDRAPVLTPNARELAMLTQMLGEPLAGDDPGQAAVALARRTGQPVVVTLGADGALIATSEGVSETIASPVVSVRRYDRRGGHLQRRRWPRGWRRGRLCPAPCALPWSQRRFRSRTAEPARGCRRDRRWIRRCQAELPAAAS